jgi:hypothetical protein
MRASPQKDKAKAKMRRVNVCSLCSGEYVRRDESLGIFPQPRSPTLRDGVPRGSTFRGTGVFYQETTAPDFLNGRYWNIVSYTSPEFSNSELPRLQAVVVGLETRL